MKFSAAFPLYKAINCSSCQTLCPFFFSESIYTEVEEATLYDKVLDICLKRNAVNSFSGNMPQPGVTEGLNDSPQSSTTKQRFGARTGALFH